MSDFIPPDRTLIGWQSVVVIILVVAQHLAPADHRAAVNGNRIIPSRHLMQEPPISLGAFGPNIRKLKTRQFERVALCGKLIKRSMGMYSETSKRKHLLPVRSLSTSFY